MSRHRPWLAWALRPLCSLLMFGSGYALLAGSTFALRMRNDAPVGTIVLVLAALLAFLPLARPKSYLKWLLVSAFILSGLGAYWWTTIPWDELIKDSGFPTPGAPDLLDHALVAGPAVVVALYLVLSRPSVLHAELRSRGVDKDEAVRAGAMSFLTGGVLLVFCGALSVGLWVALGSGLPAAMAAPIPVGLPALMVVAALIVVAYALLSGRIAGIKRPSSSAARPEAPARSPRRRSPS